MNLPQGFMESLVPLLKSEAQAFLDTYSQPYLRGLRLNPWKGLPSEHAVEGILEPVAWEPLGRYLEQGSKAGASLYHEAGCFYIQEPSAMAPARVLNPQKGEWVLDLCAAPGGKSSQIAHMLDGTGLLVANEPVLKRAQVLSQNLERMGADNALVVSALPEQLCARWPGLFDAVLVDAPCSGEGMFRRHPETRWEWQPQTPLGCAKRQKDILKQAVGLLKPGGRLCYATCTLNAVENDGVAVWLTQAYPEMTLKPFTLPGVGLAAEGMLHLWPHRIKGEGHFVALFEKTLDIKAEKVPLNEGLKPIPADMCKAALDFPVPVAPTALFGDTLVALPEYPPLQGIKVLRAGLHLGRMKGNYFMPDHALATVRGAVPDVLLDEKAAHLYLRGEVVPGQGRGFLIAGYEDLPLGWVKASDGQYKNHYPKALRKQT